MDNVELAVQFLLQIAVILFCCRLAGAVAVRCGQPEVVAEMVVGIVLGPSVFGLLTPEWQQWLFPWDSTQSARDTQSYLFPVAQLGLALYMFVVGLEFRADIVRRYLKSAVAVSVVGMIAPFAIGAALGWYFHRHTTLFGVSTNSREAILFMGASMCITAFPMLARIVHFKRLTGTTVGSVSIAAGAINDAAAWCLLAFVLASIDADMSRSIWNVSGGAAFVAVVAFVVRPLLKRCQARFLNENGLSEAGFIASLVLMAISAWFTDLIGLHAVFGAFVIGAAMPRGIVSRELIQKIQPLTISLLLPLFFTYSGLNTKMGLLNSTYLWGVCLAVLVSAVVGKGVACWAAARATGIPNREALGIGTLMNARGLMELIIINIGLQRGIISEGLFAILVIMAVATTLMTSPLFDLLAAANPMREEPLPVLEQEQLVS